MQVLDRCRSLPQDSNSLHNQVWASLWTISHAGHLYWARLNTNRRQIRVKAIPEVLRLLLRIRRLVPESGFVHLERFVNPHLSATNCLLLFRRGWQTASGSPDSWRSAFNVQIAALRRCRSIRLEAPDTGELLSDGAAPIGSCCF